MAKLHVRYRTASDLFYRVEALDTGSFLGSTETVPIPPADPLPPPSEDGVRRWTVTVPGPGEYSVTFHASPDGPAVDLLGVAVVDWSGYLPGNGFVIGGTN